MQNLLFRGNEQKTSVGIVVHAMATQFTNACQFLTHENCRLRLTRERLVEREHKAMTFRFRDNLMRRDMLRGRRPVNACVWIYKKNRTTGSPAMQSLVLRSDKTIEISFFTIPRSGKHGVHGNGVPKRG